MQSADTLVESVTGLYSLPGVYLELQDSMSDPHASLSHFGDIVPKDPALSARLLKAANSSLFNLPTKVDTISRAITVIGMQQLRELALATAIADMFQGIPQERVNMQDFWRHSITTGIVARLLGVEMGYRNSETLFVAGLLHDIGSLIIYSARPEQAAEIFERRKTNYGMIARSEVEVLGFDHSEVGGLLLQNWNLSERLVEAVSLHHQPDKATRFPLETAIIHVADIITNALQSGTSGEQHVPMLDETAWARLNLPETILEKIITLLDTQLDEVERLIIH